MVEPLRHRQTKGAATDMFYLMPPRHISTLPEYEILYASRCFPLRLQTQTFLDAVGTSHLCQQRTHSAQQIESLIDHFVGAREHLRGEPYCIWGSQLAGFG